MNLVVGTKIMVNEPMFEGSFRNATYVGDRQYIGIVINDKYGCGGKHWFTILVEKSDHESIKTGQKIRRQGKNIYSHSEILSQPSDIKEKTTDKNLRRETESYFK